MLALTRKKNESVVINGDVKIVVVEIRGDKVRLGIEAPADVPVYRSEVWAKIQAGESPKNAPNPTPELSSEQLEIAQDALFALKTTEKQAKERVVVQKSRENRQVALNNPTAQIFAETAKFAEQTLRRREDETTDFDDAPFERVDETESNDGNPTSICRFPFE